LIGVVSQGAKILFKPFGLAPARVRGKEGFVSSTIYDRLERCINTVKPPQDVTIGVKGQLRIKEGNTGCEPVVKGLSNGFQLTVKGEF